jgi:hypothetical protein
MGCRRLPGGEESDCPSDAIANPHEVPFRTGDGSLFLVHPRLGNYLRARPNFGSRKAGRRHPRGPPNKVGPTLRWRKKRISLRWRHQESHRPRPCRPRRKNCVRVFVHRSAGSCHEEPPLFPYEEERNPIGPRPVAIMLRRSFRPLRPEFDKFLFATVGDEIDGIPISVVSALARLGLDPREEAGRLSSLGNREAVC